MKVDIIGNRQYVSDRLSLKSFKDSATNVIHILAAAKTPNREFWPTNREVEFLIVCLLNIRSGRREMTDPDSVDFFQSNTDFIKSKTTVQQYLSKLSNKSLLKLEDSQYWLSPILEGLNKTNSTDFKISINWEGS